MELRKIFENLNDLNLTYRADQKGWSTSLVKSEEAALEASNKSLQNLVDDLKIASVQKGRAERNAKDPANDPDVKKYNDEVEQLHTKIDELRVDLTAQSRRLQAYKNSVVQHINDVDALVQSNPALQKEFDSILMGKYRDKMEKETNSKSDVEKNIAPSKIIYQAALNDQNVANIISTIELYSDLVKEQDDILKDPNSSAADRKAATAIRSKADKNLKKQRKLLANQFKGNKAISASDIDKVQSMSSLKQDIDTADIKINGYDEQIKIYYQAIHNLPSVAKQQDNEVTPPESIQPGDYDVPATRPKWYQFIKRFKNWYHSRNIKNEEIDKTSVITDQQTQQPEELTDKEKAQFRETMKYDVMKDYEKKKEDDYLRTAEEQVHSQSGANKTTVINQNSNQNQNQNQNTQDNSR